jgi:hypothetical protein
MLKTLEKMNDSSSDNERQEKVHLLKLNCDNWTKWKKFFVNLLTGRGHEEIFDPVWCKTHKDAKVFRKKSALAFTLLSQCVSSDLKPVAAATNTFSAAMKELAETCCKTSLIKLGDKLHSLVCCNYTPGSSIGAHVSNFQNLYNLFKLSFVCTNTTMHIDTQMAGIFFLKIFQHNNSLAPLIKNLYDIVPFTFKKLAACMNIEDSQSEKVSSSINVVSTAKNFVSPNKDKFKAQKF